MGPAGVAAPAAGCTDLAFLFTTSANQFLSERFESEHVKAALGWHAINDSVAGPSTPGTAFVLLHDHASEEAGGGVRQWGFVRGGMGVLTATMADAAREAGLRDPLRRRGRSRSSHAAGARSAYASASGEEIRAPRVLSNADPKRTFLSLCDRADLPATSSARIEAYRCMGTSIKINLAVSELPYVRGLPEGGVQPYHTGIMEMNPFIADMDFQQAQAVQGIAGRPRAHRAVLPDRARPVARTRGQAHHDDRRELPAVPRCAMSGLGRHQGGPRRPRDRADGRATSRSSPT